MNNEYEAERNIERFRKHCGRTEYSEFIFTNTDLLNFSDAGETGWVDVFRSGKQTDSAGNTKNWTNTDLDHMVSSYNSQAEHEAPVTIGHPADNKPAYGWVASLRRVNNVLQAKFRQLNLAFKDAVNKGAYKKRSISIYPSGLLRHIAFLGAVPPAVKGLTDVKL